MLEVLRELNKEVGVKGSLVLTQDGIVVAAEMGGGIDKDTVAAHASAAVNRINKALRPLGQAPFSKFVFTANHGRMVFIATGEAYIAVLLDKDIKIDVSILTIEGAARRIRSMSQIRM